MGYVALRPLRHVTTAHFATEVEMNWAWLCTIENGLVTRTEAFTDRQQALEAAGLSE